MLVNKEALSIFEHLSDFKRLRRIPEGDKTRVKERWGNKCAICHKREYSEPVALKPRVAHIVPVEEGGGIQGNLLLLCERGKRTRLQARGDINLVGCHDLLDNEGIWSRNEVQNLCKAGPNGKYKLMRIKSFSPISKEEKIKQLINKKHFNVADEEIKKLKNKCKDPGKMAGLLALQYRCERRRRRKQCGQNIEKIESEIMDLYNKLETLGNTEILNHIDYENAMAVYYSRKNYSEASEWFRRYKSRPHRKRGRWLINEAQALVSDFEDARINNSQEKMKIAMQGLKRIVPMLDKLASVDNKVAQWPVNVRLHLARIKAFLGDKDYMSKLEDAQKIRDRQNAAKGWTRLTQIWLLLTKGECHRARGKGGFCDAIQCLSLAGRKIIIEKYKNYDGLDSVLEGLLGIPEGENKYLDSKRTSIIKIKTTFDRAVRAGYVF